MSGSRDEFRFLEEQMRAIEGAQRQLTMVQSTITRRMRRLARQYESASNQVIPRVRASTPPRPVQQLVAPGAPARIHRRQAFPQEQREIINGNDGGIVMVNLVQEMNDLPPTPFHFREPKITMKTVKKKDLNVQMTDSCSVCQENYTKKDCFTTSCNHDLCSTCYYSWMEAQRLQHRRVTCPLCRESIKSLTGFRERARRRTAAEMALGRVGAGAGAVQG